MDNRIFNVNGCGFDMLRDTLRLALAQQGRHAFVRGWRIDPQKGFVLCWYAKAEDGVVAFPGELDADTASAIVWRWLESEPAIECEGWDANADHDGHNTLGWRVYCEDWGHVGTHYAIVAVKPAYLWHGK